MRKIVLKDENLSVNLNRRNLKKEQKKEQKKNYYNPKVENISLETKSIRDELIAVEEELLYRKARKNTNVFTELVMRDQQTSKPIKQAEVHITMQNHITWCLENDYFAGIMAPWGVGKSTQVLARVLDILGKKPNSRIKIVCNIDNHASQRVSSIREYLDKSEEYHKIYPGVYPDKKEKWGEHKLNVQRDTYGATDYSVEAGGVFSSAVSGRCDVLVGDDIVDYKNSVLNAASRKQVIESWENNWMSRLEPNGMVIYISTPWHKEDCSFKLLQNKRYAFLILEVSKDLSCIEVKKKYWGSQNSL